MGWVHFYQNKNIGVIVRHIPAYLYQNRRTINQMATTAPEVQNKPKCSWARGTIQLLLSLYMLRMLPNRSPNMSTLAVIATLASIAQGIFSFGLHQLKPLATDKFRILDNLCIPFQMICWMICYMIRFGDQSPVGATIPILCNLVLFANSVFCCSRWGPLDWVFKVSILLVFFPFFVWLKRIPIFQKIPILFVLSIHMIGFVYYAFDHFFPSFKDPSRRPWFAFEPKSGNFGYHEMFHLLETFATFVQFKLFFH